MIFWYSQKQNCERQISNRTIQPDKGFTNLKKNHVNSKNSKKNHATSKSSFELKKKNEKKERKKKNHESEKRTTP